MLLIKRICQELQKPVFEVMQWPESELEYWPAFWSIDHNKDKPIAPEQTLTEAKSGLKALLD